MTVTAYNEKKQTCTSDYLKSGSTPAAYPIDDVQRRVLFHLLSRATEEVHYPGNVKAVAAIIPAPHPKALGLLINQPPDRVNSTLENLIKRGVLRQWRATGDRVISYELNLDRFEFLQLYEQK